MGKNEKTKKTEKIEERREKNEKTKEMEKNRNKWKKMKSEQKQSVEYCNWIHLLRPLICFSAIFRACFRFHKINRNKIIFVFSLFSCVVQLGCAACFITKIITDLEARRVFLRNQKYSRYFRKLIIDVFFFLIVQSTWRLYGLQCKQNY